MEYDKRDQMTSFFLGKTDRIVREWLSFSLMTLRNYSLFSKIPTEPIKGSW
jgi:hypothetical protein